MFRLLLHAFAYILIHQIRLLADDHQHMSIEQMRRLFINVAVHIHEDRHCAYFRIAASYTEARRFRLISKRLDAESLIAA